MAFSSEITFQHEDFYEKISKHVSELRGLNEQIGAIGLSSGLDRLLTSYQKGSSFGEPHRTGRLAASLNATRPGEGTPETIFKVDNIGGEVGSNVEYAAIQQVGGTILPKGRFLAIPIPLELKRKQAAWPRDIDPGRNVLQFFKTPEGGVLVDEEGKLGFGTGVLYVLRTSVTLPAKEFLQWSVEDRRFIADEIWPDFWRQIDGIN